MAHHVIDVTLEPGNYTTPGDVTFSCPSVEGVARDPLVRRERPLGLGVGTHSEPHASITSIDSSRSGDSPTTNEASAERFLDRFWENCGELDAAISVAMGRKQTKLATGDPCVASAGGASLH